MNRLTKKYRDDSGYKIVGDDRLDYYDAIDKLGILEDLEDKLSCPLEVVFKALKERKVIFKHIIGIDNPTINLETHKVLGLICVVDNFALELCDGVFGDEFYVDTKDYGKTWWLVSDKENK